MWTYFEQNFSFNIYLSFEVDHFSDTTTLEEILEELGINNLRINDNQNEIIDDSDNDNISKINNINNNIDNIINILDENEDDLDNNEKNKKQRIKTIKNEKRKIISVTIITEKYIPVGAGMPENIGQKTKLSVIKIKVNKEEIENVIEEQ